MLDPSHLPVSDGRVQIRTMTHADAWAYADGTDDEDVRTYAHLPAPEYTRESVIEMIDGVIAEGLARGDLAVLTIADAATDRFLGSLVIFDVTREGAEVGFWLRPESRGRGLTGAALALASRFAERSGLRTLTARTAADNRASQTVLCKAGFVPVHRGCDTVPSGHEVEVIHYERVLAEGDGQPGAGSG